MTAKDELAALVAELDDDTAAEVLAFTRRLVAEAETRVPLDDQPTMWRRDEQAREA